MTDMPPVVPVFIPPLAAMLAQAERVKGSRLTEAEIFRIRDQSACIMMTPDDAAKMTASRGYRDVAPDNCWADWHRLRVEHTGNGYLPKIVLCVLGDSSLERSCRQLLKLKSLEHEWQARDERMASAFEASECRYAPSLTAEDFANIEKHSRVLYVLSDNFTAQEGPQTSGEFLQLGRRLLELGAVALKCESSGVAHGRTRWIELARKATDRDFHWAMIEAFVHLAIADDDDFYTCGLHLLGLPDLIASHGVLREAYGTNERQDRQVVELFRIFAYYLLAECEPGKFCSGHTFRPRPRRQNSAFAGKNALDTKRTSSSSTHSVAGDLAT